MAGVYCPCTPTNICFFSNANGEEELMRFNKKSISSSVKYGARYPLMITGASITTFKFFMANAR